MKLAVVSSEYPPFHWGGVGTQSHAVANQLSARGHEVHVFTRSHGMPPVRNHPDIRFHMVKWFKFPMAFALSFGKNAVPEVNREGGFDAVFICGNMTLLRRQDFAALRFPCLTKMSGTWAGERSALRFGEISPWSVSGINDLAVLMLSGRYDIYEDYALLYSDAVFVECENEMRAINERMKKYLPLLKVGERSEVGADGTFLRERGNVFKHIQLPDMGNFTPSKRNLEARRKIAKDDERLLLFVGRLAGRKNVMEAARIFQKYLQSHPNDRLMFIGKGNQEGRLRSFARRHGLEGRMHILQGLGSEELAVHYANADTFLFPSLWEGFGLVLLEALASGLPVVSRPIGGAPEVVLPGRNGFLYGTEEEALAALEKCGSLDRGWLVGDVHQRYNMNETMDRVERVLKKIAGEGKTRSLAR